MKKLILVLSWLMIFPICTQSTAQDVSKQDASATASNLESIEAKLASIDFIDLLMGHTKDVTSVAFSPGGGWKRSKGIACMWRGYIIFQK